MSMINANFPLTSEGRTMHLGCKYGEVANRIITVGSIKRAELLSEMFDVKPFKNCSDRGFVTYTGTFNKIPVSIIAIGMGTPNMDIFVREASAIVNGTMAFIRLGTCGTIHPQVKVGSLIIASKGSVMLERNPQAFTDPTTGDYYNMFSPIPSDPDLSALLVKNIKDIPNITYYEAMNATADFFYSTQGRIDNNFDDHNEELLDKLASKYPEVKSLEMETFHLLDLARSSKGKIRATAIAIVIAQRITKEFLSNEEISKMELIAGRVTINAITSYAIPEQNLMHGPDCVWEKQSVTN